MSSVTAAATPGDVWSIIQGHTRYWVANAAVQLGIFAELSDHGPSSSAQLAATLPAAPAQLDVLLDALVGIGLLDRVAAGGSGEAYALTEVSAQFLVPGGERYMGDLVLHSPGRHENWPLVAGTVASGVPVFPVDEDTGFWRDITEATFPTQHALAGRTAATVGLHGDAPLCILDVGAGAAPWSIALLQALPNATAVANDLPGMADLAKASAQRHGVAARLVVRAGDYRVVAFQRAQFDVVVLANVVRTEGESGAPRLLRRTAGWLRPGGVLLLADYFLDEERRGNLTALLLGVTMMANTICGRTFTVERHREWLHDAGFSAVELVEPLPGAQVIIARRAESQHG
jgi:SAM-dependent methyltransferase